MHQLVGMYISYYLNIKTCEVISVASIICVKIVLPHIYYQMPMGYMYVLLYTQKILRVLATCISWMTTWKGCCNFIFET